MRLGRPVDRPDLKARMALRAAEPDRGLAVLRAPAGERAPGPDAVHHARIGGGVGECESADGREVREHALEEGPLGGGEGRGPRRVRIALFGASAVDGDVGVCAAAA